VQKLLCRQKKHIQSLYNNYNNKDITMSRNRNWLFTINNPTIEDKPLDWEGAKYLIFQKERGEEGTLHYQGYVCWEQPKGLAAVKKVNPRAHWEIRRGTHEGAKAYCSKEDTRVEGPWEKGEEPTQGRRNDLQEIKEKLDAGATVADIADSHYSQWCRYRHAFQEYKQIKQPKRDFKTKVCVLWGPTGTGKSSFVREKAGIDCYWKEDQKWWDGYENQTHVCLDDFYGWIKYHDMLRLLDRYPLRLECKGGQVQFNSKFIWITSNKHPRDWYKDMSEEKYAALERRIDMIVHKLAPGLEGNIYEKDEQPDDAPVLPEVTESQETQDLEPNTQPLEPNTQLLQRREKRMREKEADDEYRREQEEEERQLINKMRKRNPFIDDEAQEE